MRNLKIVILFITLTNLSIPISSASTINLSSLGAYPTAQLGSDYDVKIGLKSISNIRIAKSFIQINKNKTLVGVSVLEKGSSKDGVWNIRFKIPENVPLSTYKLYIKASSGSSNLILNRNQVKFVVKTIDEYKFSSNFKFGLTKTCGKNSRACPEVSVSNNLIKTDVCKITDATPLDFEGRLSSGFPSHKKYLAGQQTVNLSWIPISFSDRKYSSNLYEIRSRLYKYRR
jgi:hypothetical protein